jgi:hypothetical protein
MKNLHLSDGESDHRFDFLNKHKVEIIKLWQTSRPQRGFIAVYVDSNYNLISMKFIKSNVKESTFVRLIEGDLYALIKISWDKTDTISKFAYGYKIVFGGLSMN